MKILPLKQRRLETEREMAKAVAERGQSEVEQVKIGQRINELRAQQARLRPTLEHGSGPELLKRQTAYQNIQQEIMQLAPLHQQAAEKTYQAGQAVIGARGENQKAVMREELIGKAETNQNLANRAESGAVALGMMDPFQRAIAAQAVELGKTHPLDHLPQETRDLFHQLAPEDFEAAALKAGNASAEYAKLQGLGVQRFPAGGKFGDFQKAADTATYQAGRAA